MPRLLPRVSCHRHRPGARAGSGDAGATLLELLVASVIFSLAIVGIAVMFGLGQTYLSAEVDDRVGVGLAQQKLEALRGLGFDCIPVGGPGQAGTPMALGPSTATALTCADTPSAQAARTYNEDEDVTDRPAGDPEYRPFRYYKQRTTRVDCVHFRAPDGGDPSSFSVQSPCASVPTAKRITVEVTPRSAAARAIRVESLITFH
jgi:hypothetical protein